MKQSIIYILLILFLFSCGQSNNKISLVKQVSITNENIIDTSNYVILKYDTLDGWMFNNVKPTILSDDEINGITKILSNCIDKYNEDKEKWIEKENKKDTTSKLNEEEYLIDLKNYNRQYFPVINVKGEKEVYINCFCEDWNEYNRKGFIDIADGGKCYFQLKINLAAKKYYDFIVNGDAKNIL